MSTAFKLATTGTLTVSIATAMHVLLNAYTDYRHTNVNIWYSRCTSWPSSYAWNQSLFQSTQATCLPIICNVYKPVLSRTSIAKMSEWAKTNIKAVSHSCVRTNVNWKRGTLPPLLSLPILGQYGAKIKNMRIHNSLYQILAAVCLANSQCLLELSAPAIFDPWGCCPLPSNKHKLISEWMVQRKCSMLISNTEHGRLRSKAVITSGWITPILPTTVPPLTTTSAHRPAKYMDPTYTNTAVIVIQGAAEKSGPLNFFAIFAATVWNFNTKFYSFIYWNLLHLTAK